MKRMNLITTLTLLGVLVLAACASSASATSEWTMDISAEMAADTPITADLTYGVNNSATDGYDDGLDANAPPADPSGFDAYFNEPGVGEGKLTVNIKSVDTLKNWTLKVVVPETKTVNVSWMPGDILSNVEMQIQELVSGEPTGPVIDMKTQDLITIAGGEDGVTKKYLITATTSAVGDTAPPAITNVANTTPTTNSVTITWDTDEDSDSLVKYGTTSGAYTGSTYDATMVMSHSITLTGLDADTTYYFVVNSTDASGNSAESEEHNFTTVTAPADNGRRGGSSNRDGTYPPEPTPAATSAPEEAASPAPTKAPTVAPTKAPTKAPTAVATEIKTTELKTEGTPGFGAVLTVFAIAGLLVAAYLVMRRRE